MTINEIIIRILIATFCGTLIGYDRARKGRNAGTKTHALVAIGAALAMLVGESLHLREGGTGDPARMASQVISGIGFLGAGTIIVTGDKKIVGLTTAATLWLSAIVGIAAGAGMYVSAAVAMLGWAITFTLVNFLDKNLFKSSTAVTLFLKMQKPATKIGLLEFLKKQKCEVVSLVKVSEDLEKREDEMHYVGNLNLDFNSTKEDLIQKLSKINGIEYVNVLDDDV